MRATTRVRAVTLLVSTLAIAALVTSTRDAHSGSQVAADCIAASESAHSAHAKHKLREERLTLATCAARACPADIRNDCTRRIADVNAAIPTIVFEVKNAHGDDLSNVSVKMDGQPIAEKMDGTAIPLDPGEHTFTFEAPGFPIVTKTLVAHESEKSRREPILIGEAAPPPLPSSSSTTAPPPPPPAEPKSSALRPAGVIVGGVGVAGIVVGAVFGVMAQSSWTSSKNECNTTLCGNHSQAIADHDVAVQNALVSTVGFAAGGALLASGIVLFAVAPSGKKSDAPQSASARLRVIPNVGPRENGFILQGSF